LEILISYLLKRKETPKVHVIKVSYPFGIVSVKNDTSNLFRIKKVKPKKDKRCFSRVLFIFGFVSLCHRSKIQIFEGWTIIDWNTLFLFHEAFVLIYFSFGNKVGTGSNSQGLQDGIDYTFVQKYTPKVITPIPWEIHLKGTFFIT